MTSPQPRPSTGREYVVHCAECDTVAALPAYECRRCDGPLVVKAAPVVPEDAPVDTGAVGVWRHAALLPRTRHRVTLGEGSTPLLPLDAAADASAAVQLFAKLEMLNPTLSFKDRGMALAASVALDLGSTGLSLASTGNAAVSAAAYAAAAGLRCRILCAAGSRAGLKIAAAASHRAEVTVVDGDYSDAYARARSAEDEGWFNVSTTYRNPVLAEGYRPMAAEIVEQLGGAVPDVVVVPVGAGPLLRSLLHGFADMRDAGLAADGPRLVGVQAQACAPLARAWGSPDWLGSLRQPLEVMPTRAGAIADSLRGYEREGLLTLQAVRDSGGAVVAVSEPDIRDATESLARRGLLVEPASAATWAALRSPALADVAAPGAVVVVVLTGHGAKEPLVSLDESRRTR